MNAASTSAEGDIWLISGIRTEAAPFSGGFEWFYALISLAAFIALWKYKQDIMKVIAACAAIGLAFTYLR